jgi:hypothetical protein
MKQYYQINSMPMDVFRNQLINTQDNSKSWGKTLGDSLRDNLEYKI